MPFCDWLLEAWKRVTGRLRSVIKSSWILETNIQQYQIFWNNISKKNTFLKLPVSSVNAAHQSVFVCSAAVSSATDVDEISKRSDKSRLYFCLTSLLKLSIVHLFWPFFMCLIHSSCSLNITEHITPFCCSTFSVWITYSSHCLGLRASTVTLSLLSIYLTFLFTLSLCLSLTFLVPCSSFTDTYTNIVTHIVKSNLWLACC